MSLLDRVLSRRPHWCRFFSKAEYTQFREHAEAYARHIGIDPATFDEHEGAFVSADARYSLRNIALQCRGLRDFSEPFARFHNAHDEGKRLDDLIERADRGEAELEELQPLLRFVVRHRGSFRDRLGDLITRDLAGELVMALVLDSPALVSFVRHEAVRRFGRTEEQWFADAEAHMRGLHTELAREDGALPNGPKATAFHGDNASALLALGADEGDRPALWTVPERNQAYRVLPQDGGAVLAAAPGLAYAARKLASVSAQPLSGELFARVGGQARVVRLGIIESARRLDIVDSEGELMKLAEDMFPS